MAESTGSTKCRSTVLRPGLSLLAFCRIAYSSFLAKGHTAHMSETVTIGLPNYNSAGTLFEAIGSIFAQTYGDWRLIVIDDGSDDDSVRRLEGIDDARVTIIADGANLGLAVRLNQIAELCQTSLLFRMDADDVMHRDRLARQIDFMTENPDVDVLSTRAYMIDEVGRVRGLFKEPELPRRSREWLYGCGITHPSIVVRRDWALNNRYDIELRRQDRTTSTILPGPKSTLTGWISSFSTT
jgi:glycosyltransferase involved in cell wall biosynthesis